MYKNMNTQVIERVSEPLTQAEINKLKKLTLGYGKLRRLSRDLGIHVNTLSGIMLRGSGRADIIQTIREKLSE